MKVRIKNEQERMGARSLLADMDVVPRIGESLIIEDCDDVCERGNDTGNPRFIVTDVEHYLVSGDRFHEDIGTTVYVKGEEQE